MNDNDELEFDFGVADFEMPAVQQNSKPATKANNKYLVAAQGKIIDQGASLDDYKRL